MTSTKWIPRSIKVKVKATHFNDFINRNALNYTANAVTNGAGSWTKPFSKPFLIGHDKQSDPIGRISGYNLATIDSTTEPQNYVELLATITDSKAIEKIVDGRYFTVSVGSRSSRVLCSECGQNIITDGLCEHKKGSFNSKGKPIYWKIDQIDYVECSFVNEPADDYAVIDQIDIGFGFVPYKDFLDNQESLILEGKSTEETQMSDAVLSSAARTKLADSAFCYVSGSGENKVRKFPAHDAAHVRNGLARLSQAKVSDAAKAKILACLKRKAKRLGITVSKDEVFSEETVTYINSLDPLYGVNDEFTADEQKELEEFFKANPDIDTIPEQKTTGATDSVIKTETDPDKMKKEELVIAYKALLEKSTSDSAEAATKISGLETKLSDANVLLTERENEVNKYIEQAASFEKKFRDALINNIIDIKKTDTNEDRAKVVQKLESRQLQSIMDTLADIRLELTTAVKPVENKGQVKDPQQTGVQKEIDDSQSANTKKDPWSIFEKDNRLVEVE